MNCIVAPTRTENGIEVIDRCPLSQEPAYLVYDWREACIHHKTGEVLHEAYWGGKATLFDRKGAELWAEGGVNDKGEGPAKLILVIPAEDAQKYGYALTADDVEALGITKPTFAAQVAA